MSPAVAALRERIAAVQADRAADRVERLARFRAALAHRRAGHRGAWWECSERSCADARRLVAPGRADRA